MEQNQPITNPSVDDDLQRAIDNITNTTNVDPVFSDPVAAPSSVPEGDTGELAEPVGPFPEPVIETVDIVASPIAPAPELVTPAPATLPNFADLPETPISTMQPVSAPEPAPAAPAPALAPEPEILNMHQVKESALRDLVPLLDHLNMNASQKFNLYRNIFESLRDYTVLSHAYTAAKEIANETERAEALLYLVESIDKM